VCDRRPHGLIRLDQVPEVRSGDAIVLGAPVQVQAESARPLSRLRFCDEHGDVASASA
jgi:hypothetical protein